MTEENKTPQTNPEVPVTINTNENFHVVKVGEDATPLRAVIEKESAGELPKPEEKKSEEKEKAIPPKRPNLFLKKDQRIKVEILLLTDIEGNIKNIVKKGLIDENILEHSTLFKFYETLEFSYPNFDQLSRYKSQSTFFDRSTQQLMLDNIKLRNYYLIWHLKDWTFTDIDGNKIPLKFDKDGSLSQDTIAVVYDTYPTILDICLNIFEKEILQR